MLQKLCNFWKAWKWRLKRSRLYTPVKTSPQCHTIPCGHQLSIRLCLHQSLSWALGWSTNPVPCPSFPREGQDSVMLMDLGEGARPARKAISTIDDVRHRQSPGNLRPLLQALFLTYWETWENCTKPSRPQILQLWNGAALGNGSIYLVQMHLYFFDAS